MGPWPCLVSQVPPSPCLGGALGVVGKNVADGLIALGPLPNQSNQLLPIDGLLSRILELQALSNLVGLETLILLSCSPGEIVTSGLNPGPLLVTIAQYFNVTYLIYLSTVYKFCY